MTTLAGLYGRRSAPRTGVDRGYTTECLRDIPREIDHWLEVKLSCTGQETVSPGLWMKGKVSADNKPA
jgi:hypothetical protein